MKILAIGAHPDDIEIFMFGILSLFKKRGDEIHLTVATDGSKGGDEISNKLVEIRKEEAILGLNYLGRPNFLGINDGQLGFNENDQKKIKDHIFNLNPDLVITHHKNDYHSDHKKLSELIDIATGHYIPVLYCDTMMGVGFEPDYYVDITDYFKIKIEAIMKHKSQNPNRFAKLSKLMNTFRSAQCNAPPGFYAEAYSFNNSFPFCDVRALLPEPMKIRSFHIENQHGFL